MVELSSCTCMREVEKRMIVVFGQKPFNIQGRWRMPLREKIDIPFVKERMNAAPVDPATSNRWRYDPSDEVDATWACTEDPRPVTISRE